MASKKTTSPKKKPKTKGQKLEDKLTMKRPLIWEKITKKQKKERDISLRAHITYQSPLAVVNRKNRVLEIKIDPLHFLRMLVGRS